MKSKIVISACLITAFFVLAIASYTKAQEGTAIAGDAIIQISLPPCPPNVTGRLDHVQVDSKGNRLEIRCNGAYQMNFSRAGGGGGFVGKCPFPHGRNVIQKKASMTFTVNETGSLKINETEILFTGWTSFDAPAPGPGVTGTNRTDRAWRYDVRNNSLIRIETRHNGTWVNVSGTLVYNVTGVGIVNVTPPTTPPSSPGLLSVAGDLGPNEFVLCSAPVPEFEFITPVPITSIADGVIATAVYKLPFGAKTVVVEKIKAAEGRLFTFDINMPAEGAGILTYSLSRGPDGMKLDPATGVISWTPTSSQVGRHPVAVMINYRDSAPHADEFILEVVPKQDLVDTKTIAILLFAIIVLGILLHFFRAKK